MRPATHPSRTRAGGRVVSLLLWTLKCGSQCPAIPNIALDFANS